MMIKKILYVILIKFIVFLRKIYYSNSIVVPIHRKLSIYINPYLLMYFSKYWKYILVFYLILIYRNYYKNTEF